MMELRQGEMLRGIEGRLSVLTLTVGSHGRLGQKAHCQFVFTTTAVLGESGAQNGYVQA